MIGNLLQNTGLFDSALVAKYTAQIQNMSLADAQATLAKANLNNAQKEQILINAGLISSEQVITAAQQQQLINSGLITSEKMSEVAATLGLQTAENGALVAKKALNAEQVKEQLTGMGVVGTTQQQIMAMLGLASAETGTAVATNGLTAAFNKLKLAFLSNPITAVITVLTTAATAFYMFASGTKDAEEGLQSVQEAAEEARNEIEQLNSELESKTSTVEEVKDRYAELAQEVKNLGKLDQSQGTLTTDEYEEFLDLSNQLSDMFPTLNQGFDENGNAILKLSGNVDTIVSSLENLVSVQEKLAKQEIIDKMPDLWGDYASKLNQQGFLIDYAESGKSMETDLLERIQSSMGGNKNLQLSNVEDKELINYLGDKFAEIDRKDYVKKLKNKTTREIELDLSDLNESEYNKLLEFINNDITKAQDQIDLAQSKMDSATAGMVSSINTWLSEDWYFKEIDDPDIQNLMKDLVLNTKWFDLLPDDIDKTQWKDVSEWLENNLLYSINNIDDDKIKTNLAKAYNGTLSASEILGLEDDMLKNGGFNADDPIMKHLQNLYSKRAKYEEYFYDTLHQFGYSGDQTTLLNNFFSKQGIDSTEELDYFNKVTDGATSASEAIKAYKKSLVESDDLLGISDTITHLDSKVKPVLDSLASAYQDIFTDDGFTLDNVGVDMLNSVKEAIAEINEIDGIDIDASAFEDFTKVLSTTEITMDDVKTKEEEVHKAFNNLVTGIINGTDSTYVSSEAFDTLVQSMKQMGVTNANEALTEIKKTQDYLIEQGIDINNITAEEAEAFLREAEALGISTQWFKQYTLQKAIAENALDTTEDIEALENLCNVLGVTGEMLEYINRLKYANQMIEFREKTGMGAPVEAYMAMANDAKASIQKLLDEGSVFEFDFEFEYDGNKAGGKDSDKDKDSTLDWVEIAVTRAEEELDRLNTAVDNTYSNWTNRSKALKEAIEDTSYAIGLQKQAYEKYLAKANSVNLPEYLKERVRLGDMSIQDHVNSDTKELIDEYSEWYNKALEAKKAQEELNQALNELNTTKQVDMIEEYYDALNEAKENGIEKLQNKIDMAETQGFFANNSYYDGIESMLEEEIRIVAQKKANLDKVLADNASLKGTSAYTELENLVTSVSNELDELYIKIEENKNSAQENEWNYFDYLRESISRVIDEADYLIELLSSEDLFDDSGNMTKYADATLALHGSNYEVYMANAKEYAEEVKALEKDLAEGKDVIDRYNEMVDAHQDAVLAAQKEKQAILDLVEEGYQAQLDALNELISKKKEAWKQEKALYDYQKSIEEKTQARDSLRRQLEVYKNDTSEEGLAQAQKLSVELKKAEDDLAETEYEKMLSDQEAMLDALSADYEEWMNERLDNSDALLTEIRDELSEKGDEIKTTLTEVAGQYGSTLSTSLTTIFGEKPFDGVTTAINNLIAKIDSYVGGNPGDSKVSGSGTNSGSGASSSGGTTQKAANNTNNNNTNKNANTNQGSKSGKYTFIDKKSVYDKNKLAKETSIVD